MIWRLLLMATLLGACSSRNYTHYLIDPAPTTAESALRVAGDLVDLLETPFQLGEDRISISASGGGTAVAAICLIFKGRIGLPSIRAYDS